MNEVSIARDIVNGFRVFLASKGIHNNINYDEYTLLTKKVKESISLGYIEEPNNLSKERNKATEIIDLFEVMLDTLGINISSDDKKGDDSEANVYGEDYFLLEDYITHMLEVYNA